MQELYHKKIMDHFHNSPYRGRIDNPDFTTDAISPSCGDHIIFTGKCLDARDIQLGNYLGSKLVDIKFTGEGSIVGQAAASLLCEKVMGADLEAILALTTEDLAQLLGIDLGPNRLRTVTFVLHSLQKGIVVHVKSRETF